MPEQTRVTSARENVALSAKNMLEEAAWQPGSERTVTRVTTPDDKANEVRPIRRVYALPSQGAVFAVGWVHDRCRLPNRVDGHPVARDVYHPTGADEVGPCLVCDEEVIPDRNER